MTGYGASEGGLLVSVLVAPIVSLALALALKLAYRLVIRSALGYWEAYCAQVFGIWLERVAFFVAVAIMGATRFREMADVVAALISVRAVGLFYASYVKAPDDAAIGTGRRTLIVLAELVVLAGVVLPAILVASLVFRVVG